MAAAGSRRAWGWHPLTDRWAERVVADAGVRPGDLVLDVGAGRGALTRPLVAAGARVLAFELHPGRARGLRESFAAAPVTVVEVDAAELLLPRRPFRVVANPPYGMTSALVRRLLAPRSLLVAADLVVQRSAARRLAALGGGGRFELSVGRSVPRSAFVPPPQVDSAVLRIRRRAEGPTSRKTRPRRAHG